MTTDNKGAMTDAEILTLAKENAKFGIIEPIKFARAILAAQPVQAIGAVSPDGYICDDLDRVFDCPDDAAIVSGRKLGDRYEVKAVYYAPVKFEVTKVPDDVDDDYAVAEVPTDGVIAPVPVDSLTEDQRVAIRFYTDNPSAALLDFRKRIAPVPAVPLSFDGLTEFKAVIEDFEDNGETAVDYVLLMDWAQRGLLECTHFEVTKAGRDALDAAKGET